MEEIKKYLQLEIWWKFIILLLLPCATIVLSFFSFESQSSETLVLKHFWRRLILSTTLEKKISPSALVWRLNWFCAFLFFLSLSKNIVQWAIKFWQFYLCSCCIFVIQLIVEMKIPLVIKLNVFTSENNALLRIS